MRAEVSSKAHKLLTVGRWCLRAFVFLLLGSTSAGAFGGLDWAIYFDLSEIKKHVDPLALRELLRSRHEALARCEAMIMTPGRDYFVCAGQCESPAESGNCSVLDDIRRFQQAISPEPPLLFGMARFKDEHQILLHVGHSGRAVALLPIKPDMRKTHLLSIIGVDLVDVRQENHRWRVAFELDLQEHLLLGSGNAGFCTKYFADGMAMTPALRRELIDSLRRRARMRRTQIRSFIEEYFDKYSTSSHLMRRRPSGLPVGNIAPYGLILPSLSKEDAYNVRERMKRLARQGLFGFSTDFVPTLADTCLALEHSGIGSADRLVEFRRPSGGFLPQLCEEGHGGETAFWCQEDFGFSAWAHWLIAREGLADRTTHDYLVKNFDRRASLFIANPLHVNYLTARSLRVFGLPKGLAEKLVLDTLSYLNADNSFGDFDVVASTLFAVSTLQACGYLGPKYVRGVAYLLRRCKHGNCGPSTPFYSAISRDGGYGLTFYEDEGLVLSALVEQFLSGIPFDTLAGYDELEIEVLRRPNEDQHAYVLQTLESYRLFD